MFAGFATLRREGRLLVLVGLGATAGFIAGIADVVVVTFVDARLDGGGGRSALLASAYGLGGIITVTCATQLLQAGRVGRSFLLGGMLAGAALLVLAVVGGLGPSLLAFAVLGGGETLLHLTSWVAVQRQAPTAVLARVFGILEGLLTAAVALGSLTVTVLVAWTSFGAAFVMLATAVPLLVLGGVARLRRHGAVQHRHRCGSALRPRLRIHRRRQSSGKPSRQCRQRRTSAQGARRVRFHPLRRVQRPSADAAPRAALGPRVLVSDSARAP